MAHFIGYLQGNREDVSRLGSKGSGVQAQAQGWDIGGRVCVGYNPTTGEDEVTFTLTAGSHGAMFSKHLGTFTVRNLKTRQRKA